MPVRKEYVLISSDDRDAQSKSASDFNIHLLVPLQNVIRTDLVEVFMTAIDLSANNITRAGFFFIQSRALGTDIVTAGANNGFWRMVLFDANAGVSQMNNRVDRYFECPRDIQDIDIRLLLSNRTPLSTNGTFQFLLEVIREV